MSNERLARSVALEQAYVHDVYEQFSDNPRSKPWPRVQEFIETLEPGSIVCDVGCGNGKYLNVGNSVFNIGGEKCKRLSDVAKEKENEVIVLDNLALPFRDESMDAVLSIAVVHHFATTERRVCALRELARVLRIGGRLIISVWAMEQSHRKFESQDVLVPWHRPQHISSPSLELTSTTTNTSEEDCHLLYHAYTQTSDSDSAKSNHVKKKNRTKHRGRSIDPRTSSSSSLSSPNETCYSFVRRAIQKLAGSRRASGVHKPWFLDTWTNCAKEVPPPPKRYDPDGCECCDCENAHDLPIELRRVDDDEMPQRRQTFPSSQILSDIYNLKSKSLTNMTLVENNNIIRSNSSIPSIGESIQEEVEEVKVVRQKPKLVKQKKSICEDDEIKPLPELPDIKIERTIRKSVLKQTSLNEELMSTDRLQEKEKLRRNIHKQASLNDDLIYQRHSFDNIRDNFFSTSTKRLQLIKTGFANKIKNSNIDKVTGASLKNGFVRMFQHWKSSEMISPTIPEDECVTPVTSVTIKKIENERRHSKEDGSDSSKDSSLQSDTSVDSEDSFASVIFVPKSNPMSPTLSPGISTSVPNSPRIKQSSCPTSPRIKQMPLSVYPLTKQLSSPKPSSVAKVEIKETIKPTKPIESLAEKYSVVSIPKYKKQMSPNEEEKESKIKKIKDLLNAKTGFGVRVKNFPIVRQSSVNNGKVQSIAKPLPKLLALELFNPETDDKDSDSSAVSSPDSVDSVISLSTERKGKFTFPPARNHIGNEEKMSLLQAAADVAHSLDTAVEKVIKTSPKLKRREIKTVELRSVMERQYIIEDKWNEECHRHLTDFADRLSEKLLKEIDQYQEKLKKTTVATATTSLEHIDDPYIHRLSEELQDLSKLSAEIQKQNEYLAKLSASDSDSDKKNYVRKRKRLPVPVIDIDEVDEINEIDETNEVEELAVTSKLNKNCACASMDSCDSEKTSSPNSSLQGHSIESDKDTVSRYSDYGSTASLASCPEWKTIRSQRSIDRIGSIGSMASTVSVQSTSPVPTPKPKPPSLSDTSQDSLPSDIGGEITYHRYYHVFREGELDQLIEKYVENLHIISSYYDHASWCVVAEKVQVWTI